jgi:hypothetical protein
MSELTRSTIKKRASDSMSLLPLICVHSNFLPHLLARSAFSVSIILISVNHCLDNLALFICSTLQTETLPFPKLLSPLIAFMCAGLGDYGVCVFRF